MILNYKEVEEDINKEIQQKHEELKSLYKTLDEAEEHGYEVAFGANTQEEAIISAFNAGRAIGEYEGKIDELEIFLNYLYSKEFLNKE